VLRDLPRRLHPARPLRRRRARQAQARRGRPAPPPALQDRHHRGEGREPRRPHRPRRRRMAHPQPEERPHAPEGRRRLPLAGVRRAPRRGRRRRDEPAVLALPRIHGPPDRTRQAVPRRRQHERRHLPRNLPARQGEQGLARQQGRPLLVQGPRPLRGEGDGLQGRRVRPEVAAHGQHLLVHQPRLPQAPRKTPPRTTRNTTTTTPSRSPRPPTSPATTTAPSASPSPSCNTTTQTSSRSSARRKARASDFQTGYGTRRARWRSRWSTARDDTNAFSYAAKEEICYEDRAARGAGARGGGGLRRLGGKRGARLRRPAERPPRVPARVHLQGPPARRGRAHRPARLPAERHVLGEGRRRRLRGAGRAATPSTTGASPT